MKMNDTVDGDDVDMLKAERNGNGYINTNCIDSWNVYMAEIL